MSTTKASTAAVGSGLPPPKRRRVPIRIIGKQDDEENKKGKGKDREEEATVNVIGADTSDSSSTTNGKAKADSLVPNSKKQVEEDNDNGFLKPVSSRSFLSSSTTPATLTAFVTPSAKTGLSARGDKKEEEENKTKITPKKDEGEENLESIDEKKVTEDFETELMRSLSATSTTTDGAKYEPKSKPTPGLKYTSSPSTSVPAASAKDGATTTTTADKSSFKANDSFQKAKQARDASKPSRVGGGIFRASGESVIFRESSSSESKDAKEKGKVHEDDGNSRASPAPPPTSTLAQAASDIPSPATSASSPIPARVPAPLKPPVAPQTLFEFSRMWDNVLSSSKGKGKEEVVWDRWGLVCVSSFILFFSPLLPYVVLFPLSLLFSSPGPNLIENEDFD